jgi:hypothetical protein
MGVTDFPIVPFEESIDARHSLLEDEPGRGGWAKIEAVSEITKNPASLTDKEIAVVNEAHVVNSVARGLHDLEAFSVKFVTGKDMAWRHGVDFSIVECEIAQDLLAPLPEFAGVDQVVPSCRVTNDAGLGEMVNQLAYASCVIDVNVG